MLQHASGPSQFDCGGLHWAIRATQPEFRTRIDFAPHVNQLVKAALQKEATLNEKYDTLVSFSSSKHSFEIDAQFRSKWSAVRNAIEAAPVFLRHGIGKGR